MRKVRHSRIECTFLSNLRMCCCIREAYSRTYFVQFADPLWEVRLCSDQSIDFLVAGKKKFT